MIALLLCALFFCLGSLLLTRSDGTLGAPEALASVALGMIICAVVVAVAWSLAIPPEWSVPILSLLVLSLFAVALWRGLFRGLQRSELRFRFGADDLVSLALTALYAFPVLYAAAWMGAGKAPAVFFNIDTPYYLGHVHALARAESFPPASLNTLGVVPRYHYGVQLGAALFTRLGGIPAHKALFLVVTPLLLIGKLAVVWRLATLAGNRGVPRWLSVLCLLFFLGYPVAELCGKVLPHLFSETDKAFGDTAGILNTIERFDTGFPMLSSLAASFLVYVMALFMVDEELQYRLPGIALSTAVLPLIKAPFLVPIGVWVGLWALYLLASAWRLGHLVAVAAAFLLALILSQLAVRPGFALRISLDPAAQGPAWHDDVWNAVLTYAVMEIAAALIVLLAWPLPDGSRQADSRGALALVYLTASVIILAFPVFVIVSVGGTPAVETLQWLAPLKWIVPTAVVLALSHGWPVLSPARRAAASAALLLYLGVPVWAKAHESAVLLRAPQSWHEFADNRPLIPALATIPVEHSLIATNDLRYPTNNYSRDLSQLQIAALFGHQAYGAAVAYDGSDDNARRVAAQSLLRLPRWNEELTKVACAEGWTHLLLGKQLPHLALAPGKMLYDSPEYAVYALPPCARSSEIPNSDK
jgi:hypothetical protein